MISGLSRSNRPVVRNGIHRRRVRIPDAGEFVIRKQAVAIGTSTTSDDVMRVGSATGITLVAANPTFSPIMKASTGFFTFTKADVASNNYVSIGISTYKGIAVVSDGGMVWSQSTSASDSGLTGTINGSLTCEAANIYQFGIDSATAVAQMVKGPDGLGTDKAAGDLIAAGGRPTGAGLEGNFVVQTAAAGGTSATQQTLATRLTVNSVTVAATVPFKPPSFTVAGVPSAATTGAGSLIWVSNEASGACIAYSNGTVWKRIDTNATIA